MAMDPGGEPAAELLTLGPGDALSVRTHQLIWRPASHLLRWGDRGGTVTERSTVTPLTRANLATDQKPPEP